MARGGYSAGTGGIQRMRIVGALAALLITTPVVACVATAPGPVELPKPPGTGMDPTTEQAPSAGCSGTAHAPGASEVNIVVDGRARRATLRVPEISSRAPDQSGNPARLLVSLHPFTMGSRAWEQYSGLAEAAVGRGYVVVSPDGSEPGPRWAVPGGLDTGADDLAFVDQLVGLVEATVCIDRNAEFAAGYSAGAAMAKALSCVMPWRFAAVAGSGGMNLTDTCGGSSPTDVFILHGTADPIAPPTGSQVVFAPPLGLPIDKVADSDAARAGCDPVPAFTQPVPGVSARVFKGCDNSHRVQHWNMTGAGHTWAGAEPVPFDLIVGPTASGFSANDVVLDFFDAT